MMQRHAHARSVGPAGLQRPPAQRDVTDVVDDQEHADRDPPGAERDRRHRQTREEWQPPGPDEAIGQRTQRAAQGFAQSLDLIGRRAVVLGAGGRPDRETDEIGMRVEEVRATRDRGTILAVAEIAEQRFFGDPDPHAEHSLVVVRALHGEQPQQRARQRAFHRSHSVAAIPPARPAANHARLGPRPTSRSVPAAPAANAVATIATASSTAPRTERTPPSSGRANHASTRPNTVTTAARSASRNNPPTCNRTSAPGSPDSSCAAAACTIREFTRRSTLIVTPPNRPVTNPTSAPRPSPRTPADACAVATAATVAGPYSGQR